MPRLPLVALLIGSLVAGCTTTDALYTTCTTDAQCGSRTYQDGEDEYTVPLVCLEVTVEVSVDRTTRGNLCTRACAFDGDCDSRIGLGDGWCVTWAGEDRGYCYQPCVEDDDCYPSSTCEDVLLDGEPRRLCLPARP